LLNFGNSIQPGNVAHDNGYFQDEGIDVELIPLIGGEKAM
jgi:ABC-type nitrate/sulfonate/bicarbonate transport system substrate-binding protein